MSTETPEQLRARLAWEARVLAEAEAEVAAGLEYELSDVLAWLDAKEADPDAPMPKAIS